jgi:hypothetical protein
VFAPQHVTAPVDNLAHALSLPVAIVVAEETPLTVTGRTFEPSAIPVAGASHEVSAPIVRPTHSTEPDDNSTQV